MSGRIREGFTGPSWCRLFFAAVQLQSFVDSESQLTASLLNRCSFRAADLEVIEIHTIHISITNVALSYHASTDTVPVYGVVRDTEQDYIAHRRGKYKGMAVD